MYTSGRGKTHTGEVGGEAKGAPAKVAGREDEESRVEWGRATTKEADSESRASYHVQARKRLAKRKDDDPAAP